MAKIVCILMVAVLAYGCARSQLAGVEQHPGPPRRAAVFQPATHDALRANARRWDALAAEARCRSSRARAAAGACG